MCMQICSWNINVKIFSFIYLIVTSCHCRHMLHGQRGTVQLTWIWILINFNAFNLNDVIYIYVFEILIILSVDFPHLSSNWQGVALHFSNWHLRASHSQFLNILWRLRTTLDCSARHKSIHHTVVGLSATISYTSNVFFSSFGEVWQV